MKKLLIGGQALVKLGSSRTTNDTDYLVFDSSNTTPFSHDKTNNIDYCNANGSEFFAAIWEMEKENNGEIATPQSLLELKAYAFVQHCVNGFWQKADDCEFDMKFLCRNFNLSQVNIASRFITPAQLKEVNKVLAIRK